MMQAWVRSVKIASTASLSLFALLGSALAATNDYNYYEHYPTVHSGESLRIQFQFDEVQAAADGPANFLIFNVGGSFSTSFLSSRTSLYAGNSLLADVDSSFATAFFTGQPGLYVFGFVVDASAIESILAGDVMATLVYTPTFSDPSGFVSLTGARPAAGISTEPLSLDYSYFPPVFAASVGATSVPEPGTLVLVALGLAGFTVQRQQARR